MSGSRSKNAVLNIIIGFAIQTLLLFITLIGRKIFVLFLSADYLGINGLYSNILSVLALAELGLGNVTQFFLYKPVADNDIDKITALMRYFRKIYTFISASVLFLGLLSIPILKYIINSDLSQSELIIYYVILLVNSCVTYFSADRTALLAANQDNRLTKYVTLSVNLVLQIVHIIVLYLWHSYIIYVFVTLLSTIANVIITNIICNKRYPYIKNKTKSKSIINKTYILNNIKSTFVYKIGATIVNNTDNILISVIVSTAAVGLYSNYLMVISGIQSFITIITSAFISGIGNLSALGNKQRMYSVFNLMLLIYQFISVLGGISLNFLFNDFIFIWLGKEYLLDAPTVFAISFSFYLTNSISPIWMYRESNGLFVKVKYLLLATAAVNIILSVILGNYLGTFGILIATSISRIVTHVWYEPKILFNHLFSVSSMEYWKKQIKYLLIAVVCYFICYFISSALPHSFAFIIIKEIIFCLVCAAAFIFTSIKSNESKELKNYILNFINKIKYIRNGEV